MLRSLRSDKGFTLIELMIVVAIIGILAAIAIPNFLRYQATSRQAEARTNLGGIYVAETASFSNTGTYDTYWRMSGSCCLEEATVTPIGLEPETKLTGRSARQPRMVPAKLRRWGRPFLQAGTRQPLRRALWLISTADANADHWTVNDIKAGLQAQGNGCNDVTT